MTRLVLAAVVLAASPVAACPPGINVLIPNARPLAPYRMTSTEPLRTRIALLALSSITVSGPPQRAHAVRRSLEHDADRMNDCSLFADVPATASFRVTANGATSNISVTSTDPDLDRCLAKSIEMLRFTRATTDVFVRVTVNRAP